MKNNNNIHHVNEMKRMYEKSQVENTTLTICVLLVDIHHKHAWS